MASPTRVPTTAIIIGTGFVPCCGVGVLVVVGVIVVGLAVVGVVVVIMVVVGVVLTVHFGTFLILFVQWGVIEHASGKHNMLPAKIEQMPLKPHHIFGTGPDKSL